MAISFKDLFVKAKGKAGGFVPAAFLKKSPGQITDTTVNYTNTDLSTLRNLADQKQVIKGYIQNSPDASMAAASLARFAITDSFSVLAYKLDGTIDVPATQTANMLAARLNHLRPHYKGYTLPNDFRSLSERAIKQMLICGSFGAELVLGPGNVPTNISVFSTRQLKYEQKGSDTVVPYIDKDGTKYYLDSPLVVIEDIDQDVETPYSASPLMAATQPIAADIEFVDDLRRAFNKAHLPRPTAKIDGEKFIESLPQDVRYDKAKLATAMQEALNSIKDELNGLRPEDVLVYFDMVEVAHLTAGNNSSADSVKEHKELLNGKVSAGLQTLPSILGRGDSSTAASTEAMAYLRKAEGFQEKLNHMFSSLLTTGVRLFGHDVYVEFYYADPELRPKSELASFQAMKQSRIMELLSYGFISDEEASIMLTGSLPSGDFTPLSGTQFYNSSSTTVENPYSNTSVTGKGVNDTKTGKDTKPKDQKPSSNKTSGQ